MGRQRGRADDDEDGGVEEGLLNAVAEGFEVGEVGDEAFEDFADGAAGFAGGDHVDVERFEDSGERFE